MNAILFFGHGSRDPQWRGPFDAILADFRGMHAAKLSELAFLEFMQPDFAAAVTSLVAKDATQIRVIPLFLAAGAHTRKDLTALIEEEEHRTCRPHVRKDRLSSTGARAPNPRGPKDRLRRHNR